MNKPIVLVIHGMGTHALGETPTAIARGVDETAAHFGFADFVFKDQVEIHEFNYSGFFDEIRMEDGKQAGAIIDHLTLLQGKGLGESVVSKLTSFFATFDDDKFFSTHWLDVIYYGLMFWGEKVRVDLAKKLNQLYQQKLTSNQDVHVIAHSLGTAVLHDTLAKLYRKDPDLSIHAPQLDVDSFKVDSIFTFANVSRLLNLLNDIADPNHSTVISGPGGCTRLMYNVFNEFDPFTWYKRYKRPIPDGHKLRIKTVRELNTHDLQEYVAAPPACYLLLKVLLDRSIDTAAYEKAVVEHGKSSINASYDELTDAFEALKSEPGAIGKVQAIEQLVKAVQGFGEKIKAITDNA